MADKQGLREWQKEAFEAWKQSGFRAIVEAVTGTGKTRVGFAAVVDSISRGRQAMVVVPSIDLLEQWYTEMGLALDGVRIGRRGNGHADTYRHYDVLITTVHSAIGAGAPMPRQGALLVADEVHRYGTDKFAKVLSSRFEERLGLTATLERQDNGVDTHLLPYFGTVVRGCDFVRARQDGIVAPVRVMTVAVPFSDSEAATFAELDEVAKSLRSKLIRDHACARDPFGEFMKDVDDLSKNRARPESRVASKYLTTFNKRRALLADCQGKLDALSQLTDGLATSNRSIVFSETKESAAKGAQLLRDGGVKAHEYSSDLDRIGRTRILKQFRSGELATLVAPRVLDEGIDVPSVDVGVIIASSSSRRQMIQRMGRILRVKPDGRAAVFVIMYVAGTTEDPSLGAHEAFLDELTTVADETLDVRLGDAGAVLTRWLSQPAPVVTPAVEEETSPVIEPIVIPQPATVPSDGKTLTAREVLLKVSSGSPAVVDGVLRCLGTINSREAIVLIRRFGLDGAPVRTPTQIAKETGIMKSIVGELEKSGLRALERGVGELLNAIAV